MHRPGGRLALGVGVFLLMAVMLVPASAFGSTTYMSCGTPPTYDPGLELSFEAKVHYVIHPRRCAWSDNGFTYRLVNLVSLRWTHWGRRTAFARGKIVDNHDQDRNGFHGQQPVVVQAG
jgi:hypothetical protein